MVSLELNLFPEIKLAGERCAISDEHSKLYAELVRTSLMKILPSELLSGSIEDEAERDDMRAQLKGQLPLLATSRLSEAPCSLSFYLVQKYRPNAFKFLLEMLGQWLVPGQRLTLPRVNAADFRFDGIGDDVYTFCEVVVDIENQEMLETVRAYLPIIRKEICLGAHSAYHARRILEIKGYSPDEKTATIQEHVATLLRRRPDQFDSTLFTEMQHVLVMCSDEFKAVRESRHICRMIGVGHLFRSMLKREVARDPLRRHLFAKILHSRLHLLDGTKTVLGIMVGVNFLKDNESLEERHVLKAVQNYVAGVRSVEGSFLANSGRGDSMCTLYLEIEKASGKDFTADEIRRLRKALPVDLRDRIEHLMHPVFMPRNEEEVMRNMLTLSTQLKYLRDIPQVMISFDEQTDTKLSFCVTVARIIKKETCTIPQLIKAAGGVLEFAHETSKSVGHVRRKYRKEASVIHVSLPKNRFLRRDNRLDLYKARQVVVDELSKMMGEFRDFNGGMISKQNELLCTVRDLLGDKLNHNEFLLENFFYSLNPVIMRTILEPEKLTQLFLLLLRTLEDGFFQGESYSLKTKEADSAAYAVVTAEDPSLRLALAREMKSMQLRPLELATTFVNVYDTPRLGYVLRSTSPERRRQFFAALEQGAARFYGRAPLHFCA